MSSWAVPYNDLMPKPGIIQFAVDLQELSPNLKNRSAVVTIAN